MAAKVPLQKLAGAEVSAPKKKLLRVLYAFGYS